MELKVSVCIFSYNFKKFLAHSIDSVLAQETNFEFEIIIADDCSTDGSKEILEYYKEKYPSSINLLINNQNKGGTHNWLNAMNYSKGKYIALLDGDDYFSDKGKLQIQFDALEQNPKANICFHDVLESYDDSPSKNLITKFDKNIYSIEDVMEHGWFIRTSSTFLRKTDIILNPPTWIFDFPYRYDTIMHVFLLKDSFAVNINRNMTTWRKHSLSYSVNFTKKVKDNLLAEIALHKELDKFTDFKYQNLAKRYISKRYTSMFIEIIKNREMLTRFKLLIISLIKMDLKYFYLRLMKTI